MSQHQEPMNRDQLPPLRAIRPRVGLHSSAPVKASAPVAGRPIRRVLPLTTMLLGLGLTAAWVSVLGYLLGYALVALVGLAI